MTVTIADLQEVLAAEHAAVYGYGALGARLSGPLRREALAGLDHHRARRDRLRAMVTDRGQRPVESSASYLLPAGLTSPAAAVRLAAELEERVAVAFGILVAAASGDERAFAARALQDAAIRGARWKGGAARFPGVPRTEPTPTATPSAAAAGE